MRIFLASLAALSGLMASPAAAQEDSPVSEVTGAPTVEGWYGETAVVDPDEIYCGDFFDYTVCEGPEDVQIAEIPEAPSGSLGGSPCSEIKSPSGTHPDHVAYRFWDNFGCVVPLRRGTDTWGATHIRNRFYRDGQKNHEVLTKYGRDRIQPAIAVGGKYPLGNDFYRYSYHYTTPGGRDRVMCVFVDKKKYNGHGWRGITTAYYVSGTSPSRC